MHDDHYDRIGNYETTAKYVAQTNNNCIHISMTNKYKQNRKKHIKIIVMRGHRQQVPLHWFRKL